MGKILIILLLSIVLLSCSSTIYYYEGKDYYGVMDRNELTFYSIGSLREFDSQLYYDIYQETNGWKFLDLDSLVKVLNEENKEKQPIYRFEEKVKINLFENGIIYEHSEPKQIDTFRLVKKTYQNNIKLPVPKYLISSSAVFNQGAFLKQFKNNFAVQYVKDTLFHFIDQEIERVHIFYLYPSIYSPGRGYEKVLDTSLYSNPIILGISSKSGVPLYAATTKTFFNDDHFIESLKCYNWVKIKGVSRKKLELLLR